MTKTNVGLTAEQINGVVEILKSTLADEFVLYTKTRNYHWNVTGPHFNDLHKFFESQYDALAEKIDDVAENIRYFGATAPGSMKEYLAVTRLRESEGTPTKAAEIVKNLLADHEALIQNLRRNVETADATHRAADVADFLTGLLEDHEKMAWMLRAMAG